MHYRRFGRLDYAPSALGFGAMRLPVVDGAHDRIDREAARELLVRAVEGGVNYVDTAYNYHGGTSEEWLGWALQGGLRERVKIATKLPSWKVERADDFDRMLEEQLERLGTGIDFYLLHSLDEDTWRDNVLAHDVLGAAERALTDGRIGHFGFSFHDRYEAFELILDGSDLWEFCQIQYNYMDEEYQAGRRGLELAAARGLAVVVMEPLRGGQLARPTPAAEEAWAAGLAELRSAGRRPPDSPVEWALRWLWDQPEVALLLSGMSTLEQVEQNLTFADRAGVGLMTLEEQAVIARVRDAYRESTPIPCTGCKYCLPCPNKVAIPDILDLYNDAVAYADVEGARTRYTWLDEETRAQACTACGECEDRCPQGIAIAGWLEKAQSFLAVGEDGGG
ncbi:MAG: aldo/keto reductase [Thermoleophilia bacterium]|jgi:predicted aldo/keto reductase-like oxidoreductase|nr:aldo/keto reductase [Thermoleophilia bacterium]